MLEELSAIRSAARTAVENAGITVFSQRQLSTDDLQSLTQFVTLTIVRSDSEDDGSSELWRLPVNVGCYLENPSTDDDLEALATQVKQVLETATDWPDVVNGIVYQGHQYPNEQGDDYAAIDIQFELILS